MTLHDETLDIPVDGQHIAGTLLTPGGELIPAVLFVHGWGGSQEQYLARAASAAEAAGWVNVIQHGATSGQIIAAFLGSQEYFHGHNANAGDWSVGDDTRCAWDVDSAVIVAPEPA